MRLVFLIILVLLSSCTTQQYHEYKLTHSIAHGHQVPHMEALQEIHGSRKAAKGFNKFCGSYAAGYGGFTISCS